MAHNCQQNLYKCSRSFFLLLLTESVALLIVKHSLWILVPGAFCSDSFLQKLGGYVRCFCAPSREGELLAERLKGLTFNPKRKSKPMRFY